MALVRAYKRHAPPCTSTNPAYRRCACYCYAKGTLTHPKTGVVEHFDRVALHTTDFTVADSLVQTWIDHGTSKPIDDDTGRSVEDAVTTFLREFATTGHADSSYRKYVLLLQKRLVPYCQRMNKTFLVDVTRTDLANFRGTWPMADNARLKTQELLKAFWRYCVDQHWIPESPARTLSKIKPTTVQVQPFSHAEMEEILAACDRYPTTNSFGVDNRAVIAAFVLLLRWSGLRISDAVVLLWKNVQDGVLNVKCQKNDAHVTFRLNPVVLEALARIRRDGSPYIFYKGIGSPRDAKGKIKKGVAHSWQRSLRTLFALTTIGPDHDDVNGDSEAGHAHRFRHTFAVEWLMANPPIPIESVAQMLGDTLKTTSDTYNAWTNARHHQLGAAMAKHWATVSPSGAPVAALAPASTHRLPPASS